MSRKMRDHTGRFHRIKNHAVMAVEIYKGWKIVRIPGGPGAEVAYPTYKGVLVSRALSTREAVRTVETMTYPFILQVKASIDNFQNSDFRETERKVIVHG